jgi:signal transduction histidine kinase
MDSSFPANEIIVTITIGIIVMLLFAIAFILFYFFSQKKFESERLSAKERELRYQMQLLFGNIQTQEEERARIARELHDEVGSKLNVIRLGLYQLEKVTPKENLLDIFNVLDNTMDVTRRISYDLLPPTLERFGLDVALEELCESYQKNKETEIVFNSDATNSPNIDAVVSLNFFRIAQELLSNGFKHSGASKIELKLLLNQENIQLHYQDNGKGFTPEEGAHQMGLGRQNIESRAKMIQATTHLESEKDRGVIFKIRKTWT